MRLQLISAAVLAYIILTIMWLCYAHLGDQYSIP